MLVSAVQCLLLYLVDNTPKNSFFSSIRPVELCIQHGIHGDVTICIVSLK